MTTTFKTSMGLVTALAMAIAFGTLPTATVAADPVSPALLDTYLKGTFKKLPEGWTWDTRVAQDETQRICSETRNKPSKDDAAKILARETATVQYPADGKFIGSWKDGEKISQNGRGGQFSDEPGTVSGGNCYACHQMAPKELSYGTIGPSLLNYGKSKGFAAAEVKAAYAKIYNAQSAVACSNMPRFGYHKVLTEQQMKDVVAYLFDPESPVNK